LQETAKTFTRQGDYANAILVLSGAVQKDPQNLELQKDLAFNYYLEKDYAKGLGLARSLADRPEGDVQCYQLAGLFYKAVDDPKECEKLYKAGLKKFPHSGVLYNEYGEMLFARTDMTGALRLWEKGIETDPSYSSNYYNAGKYYLGSPDSKVWGLVYSEIFLNLESYSRRTAEMKELLLEGYKKLLTDAEILGNQNSKNAFAGAYLGTLGKLTGVFAQGITTETLIVMRTRFVLNWFEKNAATYPFKLFDHQRQLAKDGSFDAYNQWIFGAAENLSVFQTWSNTHSEEYNRFINFQKGRVFKLPEGQYYQTVSK
jgi:hypothetical protein